MKKYFVVSDIHSFYDELIEALKNIGWDYLNPDHCLIVCGDIFDRGPKSSEVYDFLRTIPKERRILIRGNHEYLLRDVLKKKFPDTYDFSNGTVKTVCNIIGTSDNLISWYNYELTDSDLYSRWANIVKRFNKTKILDWILSDEWVNYFETEKYIFVHSFIPLRKYNKWISYYGADPEKLEDIPNWRTEATNAEWEGSTWGCPYMLVKHHPQDKTIVCGHWHTSDFYDYFGVDREDKDKCPIFESKEIIALDACTAWTKRVNIFTFEE